MTSISSQSVTHSKLTTGSIVLYIICLALGLVGASTVRSVAAGFLSGWHQTIYYLYLIMLVAGGFLLYVGGRGLARKTPFKSLSRSAKVGIWVAIPAIIIPLLAGLLFLWALSQIELTF